MFPAEHLFIQTFWQTMNREWPGIDGLRLDKFRMVRVGPQPLTQSSGWGRRLCGAWSGDRQGTLEDVFRGIGFVSSS